MKLIERANDRLHLHLPSREKEIICQLLQLYPRIPSGYQRLTQERSAEDSNQRLLDEALAETRVQNKKALQALLADPHRLRPHQGAWRLTLSSDDLEWLLQVLNDIRVGSWIHLGSPDYPLKILKAESAADFWAMEMAGSFQVRLLEILQE